MVTPFDSEGRVDYGQARRLALALLDSGSDGLVVSGTTGEAPTLSKEEKLRLFREVKEAVGSRAPVIAGVGTYDTAESVEMAHAAEKIGVDGLLLVVPYYNRPPQEGLYQHFATIARATSQPCIMYNIPGRTGVNMAAETVIRLSEIPNIVGLKEASANFEQIARIIEGCPKDFMVYSGNDSDTILILALGGHGVIAVASHLVGQQMKRMMERYGQGQVAEAAAIHRRLLPLFSVLFVAPNPIPIKYAMNAVGFRVGRPRLPLVELDAKSAALVDAELKRVPLDLPVAAYSS